jgi:hypothetical protein
VANILSADSALESAKIKAGEAAHAAMLIGGMDFALVALAAAKADPESGKIDAGSLVGDMSPAEAKDEATRYHKAAADLKKAATAAAVKFKAAAFDDLLAEAEADGLGAASAVKVAEAKAKTMGIKKADKTEAAALAVYETLKKRLQRAGERAVKAAEALAMGYTMATPWQESAAKAAKAAEAVSKAAKVDDAKADAVTALAAVEATMYALGYTVADVIGLIGGTATAVAVAKAAEADAAEAIAVANMATAEADKAKARKAAVAKALNEAMAEDNPATAEAKAAGVKAAEAKAKAKVG